MFKYIALVLQAPFGMRCGFDTAARRFRTFDARGEQRMQKKPAHRF